MNLIALLYVTTGCFLVLVVYWFLLNWEWVYPRTVGFFKGSVRFIKQVGEELQKCTWPWDPDLEPTNIRKYRELIQLTFVVIVSVVLLAGLVSVSDLLIHPAVGYFTSTGQK